MISILRSPAARMAAIAFINQNFAFGCFWGSFSVLLSANEAHYGISRELSSLGVPAVTLATALLAPVTGWLAVRYSLRLIMLVGSILALAGYVVLATSHSYPLYMIAFGLLLGPSMAVAIVMPPTLVTRWYPVNSGRVLGIIATPVIPIVIPLLSGWALGAIGLPLTYGMLAALTGLVVIANLFIVDQPPAAAIVPGAETAPDAPEPASQTMTTAQLLGRYRFWAVVLPVIAGVIGAMMLSSHMVPMALSWGMTLSLAAALLSIQSLFGMFGTVGFGWLADKLGGRLTLLILVVDSVLLWLLLLLPLPFAAAAVVIGLIGFHSAGAMPVLGVLLTENFGQENFSRAYGLMNLVNLPFSVICVPAAAVVFARTGSYAGAIAGEAVFLALGAVLLMLMRSAGRRSALA